MCYISNRGTHQLCVRSTDVNTGYVDEALGRGPSMCGAVAAIIEEHIDGTSNEKL